jgi:EAL and modified HD-GYP domain-containing signal transduction protein
MADQPAQELFLGRQPILDRRQNLAGFELLFRSGHFNGAQVEDDVFASATVINHAFSELGVEEVLGRHPGFINLTAPLIMSEVIELLPKNKVVLEILETTRHRATRSAANPQAHGFTRARRLHGFDPAFPCKIVDIVKVDVQHMDPVTLSRTLAEGNGRRCRGG